MLFYRDVWFAWNKFKFYNRVPVSDKGIQNDSLWKNEMVLIGKKIVHGKGRQRVGIIKVADLITERGEFMDRDMIEETYGIKGNRAICLCASSLHSLSLWDGAGLVL